MMVWENVLSPRLRNMNSDSLNRESVYSNSMVAEMSSLLANTHTHTHIFFFHYYSENIPFTSANCNP